MQHLLQQLFQSGIFGLTGFLVFLTVYNRGLLHLRHGTFKSILCYSAMIVLPAGAAVLPLAIPPAPLIPVVLSLLGMFTVMEIIRRWRQNALRASGPVSEVYLEEQIQPLRLLNLTTEHLVIREFQPIDFNWRGPGIRMAHLSDFHIDKNPNTRFYERLFETLSDQAPDVLFLTGDYTDDITQIPRLTGMIRQLKIPLGIFASLGNHDYWSHPQRIRDALESAGVVFPDETGRRISVSDDYSLVVHRLDYPYIRPWTYQRQVSTPVEKHIVLSHTPDNFFRLARLGADLIFSGHLHGGQWRLPLIGSVVAPSVRDRLIDHGYFRLKSSHMFVTAGIGNVWMPIRINCPPEILLVDLKAASDVSVPDSEKVLASQAQKVKSGVTHSVPPTFGVSSG
ncbi:MAG TPA: metallophosphoesterase [bacterium]|nr:metallophosphoesterase [bacterium]